MLRFFFFSRFFTQKPAAGAQKRRRGADTKPRKSRLSINDDAILALIDAGHKQREIGAMLGCSNAHVSRVKVKHRGK